MMPNLQPHETEPTPAGAPSSGFSLVEVMAGLVILVVGLLALALTVLSSTRASAETRNDSVVIFACRTVFESLNATDRAEIVGDYGPSSGQSDFWLSGDGAVSFSDPGDSIAFGAITLFDDESAVPAGFGNTSTGFDLNGNGTIEGTVDDFHVLPVRLELTVPEVNGDRQYTFDYLWRTRQ